MLHGIFARLIVAFATVGAVDDLHFDRLALHDEFLAIAQICRLFNYS